jgi:hypothetical protein
MFKEDGNVIHFAAPKGMSWLVRPWAALQANPQRSAHALRLRLY